MFIWWAQNMGCLLMQVWCTQPTNAKNCLPNGCSKKGKHQEVQRLFPLVMRITLVTLVTRVIKHSPAPHNYIWFLVLAICSRYSDTRATCGETHFEGLFSLKGSGSCVSSGLGHESHVSRHYYCCLSSVFFLENPVTSNCPLEDSGPRWPSRCPDI